jgi:hypothetical protein
MLFAFFVFCFFFWLFLFFARTRSKAGEISDGREQKRAKMKVEEDLTRMLPVDVLALIITSVQWESVFELCQVKLVSKRWLRAFESSRKALKDVFPAFLVYELRMGLHKMDFIEDEVDWITVEAVWHLIGRDYKTNLHISFEALRLTYFAMQWTLKRCMSNPPGTRLDRFLRRGRLDAVVDAYLAGDWEKDVYDSPVISDEEWEAPGEEEEQEEEEMEILLDWYYNQFEEEDLSLEGSDDEDSFESPWEDVSSFTALHRIAVECALEPDEVYWWGPLITTFPGKVSDHLKVRSCSLRFLTWLTKLCILRKIRRISIHSVP